MADDASAGATGCAPRLSQVLRAVRRLGGHGLAWRATMDDRACAKERRSFRVPRTLDAALADGVALQEKARFEFASRVSGTEKKSRNAAIHLTCNSWAKPITPPRYSSFIAKGTVAIRRSSPVSKKFSIEEALM